MQADGQAEKLERRQHDPNTVGSYPLIAPDTRLTFLWNGIAQVEEYQHDLLRKVVEAGPGTQWGADALVALLRSGSVLSEDERVPLFKVVIEWLSEPGWQALKDTRLTRIEGEAYETWWSLSKASPDEPMLVDAGVSPSNFVAGAEEARLKAIADYERVLLKENDPALRRRTEELKSGHGTDQRRWFRWGD